MSLSDLTEGIPGARLLAPGGVDGGVPVPATPISAIAYRAESAVPGCLFCCLPGARADGHDFAPEALARGAAALLVERPLPLPAPQVLVPDARLGMALAAAALEGRPSEALRVVGVTGTNGKTTTAFLLRAVLEAAGLPCGLLGTIEARVGGAVEPLSRTTPESADLQRLLARMRDAGDRACAMEVSSHALVQRRVAGVRFAAALFTNLTRDHLDYHPTVEDYYRAKRGLFMRPAEEGPDPPGAANVDDEIGRRLVAETGALGLRRRRRGRGAARGGPPPARRLLGPRPHAPRGGRDRERACGGASTWPTSSGSWPPASSWGSTTRRSPPGSPRCRGCRGASSRSTPASRSRSSSTTRTRPTPWTTSCAPPATWPARGGCWSSSAAAAIATGASGPRWGRSPGALADVAVITSDNPRTEDPDAIIAEILAGAVEGAGRGRGRAGPPRGHRPGARGAPRRATWSSSPARATSAARSGTAWSAPFDDREVTLELLAAAVEHEAHRQ